MISADVTADGVEDLVVVVVYTDWADVATFEETQYDGIEGMVEVMNVVTSLTDHRELRVYPGLDSRVGYGDPLPALDLDTSVHALAAGHPRVPLVAITDAGIAGVRFDRENPDQPLGLKPLVEGASLFTGTAKFFASLDFLVDLDEDDIPDILLPTEDGWTTFQGTADGFHPEPQHIPLPPEPAEEESEEAEGDSDESDEDSAPDDPDSDDESEDGSSERKPTRLPKVRDLNGDGLPELSLVSIEGARRAIVYRNRGDLRFDDPIVYDIVDETREADPTDESPEHATDESIDTSEEGAEGDPVVEYVYFGPLERGGPAYAVTRTELARWDDTTMSEALEQAKRPPYAYAGREIREDLTLGPPADLLEAIGYTFEGGDEKESDGDDDHDIEIRLPAGFQDLDGDGREDLVSIGLEFSIVPLITRALITQSIKLTMDFFVWCQLDDGSFRQVPGLDLSGKFKFNFRKNLLRHLSQFAGDFNADGRADFIQLGRGKRATIHAGGPDCTYPNEPSTTIRFEKKPMHLGFVRVLDLNRDARSDLYVVHPHSKPKKGAQTPVRVDLYFSQSE